MSSKLVAASSSRDTICTGEWIIQQIRRPCKQSTLAVVDN